jgi:hypothetical protein
VKYFKLRSYVTSDLVKQKTYSRYCWPRRLKRTKKQWYCPRLIKINKCIAICVQNDVPPLIRMDGTSLILLLNQMIYLSMRKWLRHRKTVWIEKYKVLTFFSTWPFKNSIGKRTFQINKGEIFQITKLCDVWSG